MKRQYDSKKFTNSKNWSTSESMIKIGFIRQILPYTVILKEKCCRNVLKTKKLAGTEIFCPGQRLLFHKPHLLNERILLLLADGADGK